MPVLIGRKATEKRPEPPLGFTALERVANLFDQGALCMYLTMIYYAPLLTARAVLEAGGNMDQTFKASQEGAMMWVIQGEKQAHADGFSWAGEDGEAGEEGPSLYHPSAFVPVDWRQLREKAGEPEWTPPEPIPGWRQHEHMAADGLATEKSRLHR